MGTFINNAFDLGVDENSSEDLGLIRQRRNHLMAIWLGLFAMLMIHVGPLISGAQALMRVDTLSLDAATDPAMQHDQHDHTALLAHDLALSPAGVSSHAEHAEHAVDYHALIGHQSAPEGTPQWLANLKMCGYCELLALSPLLLLALVLALPVPPLVQWLVVLPAPLRLQPAAHSLRHSRAPPVHLFA